MIRDNTERAVTSPRIRTVMDRIADSREVFATIRKARLEDYTQACRLMDAGDLLHREGVPWMFKAPDTPPRSEAYFADLLARDDSAVFVADAGQLVGIAIGLLRAAPELSIFHQQ